MTRSSVELAQQDSNAMAPKRRPVGEHSVTPRKVWSLKLILTVVGCVLFWAAGLFWVLRPEPTAASIVAEVATLGRARTIVVEPEMVFFQLDIPPAHQERWIETQQMEPIDPLQPIGIPTYHAIDTWEKPAGYIRPPYAAVEVDEWWNLRQWNIQYGFTREWEDGSIMILDFESDTLIGWVRAKLLREVMN